MEQLRDATRGLHTQLEALPFVAALFAGRLPLESYVGQLRALAILHGVLEHTLNDSLHPVLKSVWEAGMNRLPLLEKDLAYFQPRTRGDIPEATAEALRLAERVRLRAVQEPLTLLGYVYVLEGSTQGAAVLRPQVAETFQLSNSEGQTYLLNYGDQAVGQWMHFGRQMNQAITDPAAQRGVVEAACEAFEGLTRIFGALYPVTPEALRTLVTSLNPEAGSHPIPSDPRELSAAVRAGERCWQRFPYLAQRYAQRGQKFTSSDSAWLVTLAEYDQPRVHQQVAWLGQVLAGRGMPRLLLETHLELLYEELTKAIPEKQAAYQKLLNAARQLAETRRHHVDDALSRSLATSFDVAVGQELSERLPGTGALLVAAVADERAGVQNAVESLESWLTDSARFPQAWIGAVRAVLQVARKVAN
jgi:heme oxygenase